MSIKKARKLGLALAFAASTATFNATYRTQAEVDAQLTNGDCLDLGTLRGRAAAVKDLAFSADATTLATAASR